PPMLRLRRGEKRLACPALTSYHHGEDAVQHDREAAMAGLVTLIGRLCFVAIFGWAASDYLLNWPARVQMLLDQTGAEPWVAEGLLGGALVLLCLGVLSIAIGLLARWGAGLLVIFLIPTTLLFHDFWNLSGAAQAEQLPHFYKNLGL